MSAPVTPRKGKSDMGPPPLPSPSTPSTALVLRSPGPHTPTNPDRTVARIPSSPAGSYSSTSTSTSASAGAAAARPAKQVIVQVKTEPGHRRPVPPFTPPPTSRPHPSSRTTTPASTTSPGRRVSVTSSPRSRSSIASSPRRRSSVTPSLSRQAGSTSSAARARAALDDLARRRSRSPSRQPTPAGSRSRSRSATVVDDDEQEVFWRGRGSTDEPIEIDGPPSPSPNSNNLPATDDENENENENDFALIPAPGLNAPPADVDGLQPPRSRAESELSTATLDSFASDFRRASTWIDRDPRYGRAVPSVGRRRQDGEGSNGSTLPAIALSPISASLTRSLAALAELIKALPSTTPSAADRWGLIDPSASGPVLTEVDKTNLVIGIFFPRDVDRREQVVRSIHQAQDDIAPHALQSLLDFLRSANSNALLAHLTDYKTPALSKGSKESRQAAWFGTFRAGVQFSTLELRGEVSLEQAVDTLSIVRTVWSMAPILDVNLNTLKRSLDADNVTPSTLRRLADALAEFSHQVVQLARDR